ncbi:MAG: hypothetical protein KDB00_08450 [Planctomycetales bacterium]|nr:hypothetical protein [Planctomycetales bacterium]
MKIKCPGCATLLQIPDSAAGKVVKCKCGKQLRAPAPAGATPQPQQATPRQPAPRQPAPQRTAAPQPSPAAPVPYSPFPAPAPAGSGGIFDELTDSDLSGVKAVKIPGREQRKAPTANEQKLLQEAAVDHKREKASEAREYIEGAKKQVFSSIGIYLVLGLIQVGVGGFLLAGLEKEAEILAMQDGAEEVSIVIAVIATICIFKVCLGVLFFIASATFLALPMTSAILAMIAFVLGEIVSLILYPIALINIWDWIRRAAIFGGLVQAINNASYYRFVRAGGRDKDASPERQRTANKMDKRAVMTAVGAVVALVSTFSIGGFFIHRAFTVAPTLTAKGDPARGVPEGFSLYETHGVSIFLPRGLTIDPAAGEMEYKAIATPLGTVFMMGVADVGDQKLTGDALSNMLERLTKGKYQRADTSERNGYPCDRGAITKSIRFAPRENTSAPMLNVEVFQDDGRLIVVGVAQEISSSENYIVGQSAEPELEKVFFDSFKIGPKPDVGFSFW